MSEELPTFGAPRPGAPYRPRPGAYAIVLDARGRVALVEEEGEWYLPGGGLEGAETPEQALVREVHEECACGARLLRPLGRAREFVETRAGVRYEVLGHFFRAEFVGVSSAGWHAPDEARRLVSRRCHAWAIGLALAAGPERNVDG